MSMTVLVTGGAGYIGSHVCKALATAGNTPVAYDNMSRGHRWAVKWGPLEIAELADIETLGRVLRKHKVTAVVHMAAYAYVGESMTAPELYFRNNIGASLVLLDAMQETDVRFIVFSSSCATYGIPHRLPILDDHPQQPVSPYGESKLAVEKVLYWYGAARRLSAVALRYFNAAGADPDGELGENHVPETHLVPLTIQAALGERSDLAIFGADYGTPDGTAIRDYVHVSDLAKAHVEALQYLRGGGATTAFNLGTGQGYSVREVIRAVERVSGRRVAVREMSRRPGDVPVLIADAAKASSVLGWRPGHSSLDRIVATAWRWHTARSGRSHGQIRQSE